MQGALVTCISAKNILKFQSNFFHIFSWGSQFIYYFTDLIPIFLNCMDPDQLASEEAIQSGSTLFFSIMMNPFN